MSIWAETYEDIRKRFTDWDTTSNTSASFSDVALQMINRAQRYLWQYRPWQLLQKVADLTVTNGEATFPSDYGRVLQIYDDTDGDGFPDEFYHQNGFPQYGYRLESTFTKAAGHGFKAVFYDAANIANLKLLYVTKLDDFAGNGTEYSFFTGDLLHATARWIRELDRGVKDQKSFQQIEKRKEDALRDWSHLAQHNNMSPFNLIRDTYGHRITLPNSTLDGTERAAAATANDPDELP